MRHVCLAAFCLISVARAQILPLPVILVNGFQLGCTPPPPVEDTFGQLSHYLVNSDRAPSIDFFNTCDAPPGSTIEDLASIFSAKMANYTAVDVVAHSEGGLIVRAYLQGRFSNTGLLTPPANPKIRKVVFLGTPHVGVSSLYTLPFSNQTAEMHFGSAFLWNLTTWNQVYDDLRGVDALAIAGYDPTGNSNDGVVDVDSAALNTSIAASVPARTRVVPYCHSKVLGISLLCSASRYLPWVDGPDHLVYQTIRSFLSGNSDWQAILPEADSVFSKGGIAFLLADSMGQTYAPNQLTAVKISNTSFSTSLVNGQTGVWFGTSIPKDSDYILSFTLGGQTYQVSNLSIPGASYRIIPAKVGPSVVFVYENGSIPTGSLSVAADSLISIYGAGLSSATAQASYPWPSKLADVTVTVDGIPAALIYARTDQVNAVMPARIAPGLHTFVLTNSTGKHALNIMVEPAVPSLLPQPNNAASARHATGEVVTTSNPARLGEYVSLFATGLGSTVAQNGLQWATLQPTVFIDGKPANIIFAGRAPTYVGLDQLNVQIPQGVHSGASVPVVVVSGSRVSNSVLLAVQ